MNIKYKNFELDAWIESLNKLEAYCFDCRKQLKDLIELRFLNSSNKVTLVVCENCFRHYEKENDHES